jgi:hypothetical protein
MVQNLVGYDDIPDLGNVTYRVVHYKVYPTYLSPTHLEKCDNLIQGN